MQSKKEKIASFNPNGVGNTSANIFGLPFNTDESSVIIIPAPWDVSASYKAGASDAPAEILKSSPQTNLYNPICPDAWKAGIAMEEIPEHIFGLNKELEQKVKIYRDFIQNGGDVEQNPKMLAILGEINKASAFVTGEIELLSKKLLSVGKHVGLLGGDHSTPLGLIRALAEKYTGFGILQIDAHSDLCNSYEGLEQSHASIMYNVMSINEVKKIVQVGIREFSHEENQRIQDNPDRIDVFCNHYINKALFEGQTWASLCDRIVSNLPENVYITFDIDGLEPSNCPSTGTPVPGGLTYDQAMYLLDLLAEKNRTVIGFDLVEVAPGNNTDLDTIIAARILFKLAAIMIKTNNLA